MSDVLPFAVFAGLFGLLFGSFLNVCIYRVPRDLSIVAPRSFCPSCHRQIGWYDNVPVLSYLLLQGRCRGCRKLISWRYPAVELTTGLLFFLTVTSFGREPVTLKWLLFESLMVVLFWTDAELHLLPDEFTLGGILVGFVCAAFVPMPGIVADLVAPGSGEPLHSLLNAASGTLVLSLPFAVFAFLYTRIRKIVPPGLGDVKLLGTLGAFLGVEQGLLALLIGSLCGSVLGLGYMLITRKDPQTYLLPFGTFLCAAAVLVVFWGSEFTAIWWNWGW